MKGIVFIVGAGPGDPSLLTIRGLELIKGADIVLYDRLVGDPILNMIPGNVQKEYTGRNVGDDSNHQDKTNELMLGYAKDGKKVVRLKGGDPFVFGRGGEEAEFLREYGIDFEIIPGVSSAIASPAYAGIPLTHRILSSSVAIVTGHEDVEKEGPKVRWKELVGAVDTIVVLMGMGSLEKIVSELIFGGIDMVMPVAVVCDGTTERQKVVLGNLSNIVIKVKDNKVGPPAIIVIGKVVDLAEKLDWVGVKNA